MKIALPNNISKFRKEKNMTQDELAEALGVTFAAVSKWERGIATPDISLIIQMASLFDVSLDTLIGYEIKDNKLEDFEKDMGQYVLNGEYDKALDKANHLLFKYPNNFKVVYLAGRVYYLFGLKTNQNEYIYKSIELLKRSIPLLNQNDNNDINEITIWADIADCYIEVGEIEKGIKVYKKYNVQGLFDPMISYSYTSEEDFNLDDVTPFINSGLTTTVNDMILVSISFYRYYLKAKNYKKGLESLVFLIHVLEELKKEQDKLSFMDKIIAYAYANCAVCYSYMNDKDNVFNSLNQAYAIAKKYDLNPIKKIGNLKLYTDNFEDFIDDGLGKTAIEAIDKSLKNKEICKLWEEIKENRA